MSAPALLAELDAAGIHLRRDGEDLLVEVPAGASLDPFRERIRLHKPAVLAALLKEEIVAALNVEARDFDRPAYLELVALWKRYDWEEPDECLTR
jgi:hypothetical protein